MYCSTGILPPLCMYCSTCTCIPKYTATCTCSSAIVILRGRARHPAACESFREPAQRPFHEQDVSYMSHCLIPLQRRCSSFV